MILADARSRGRPALITLAFTAAGYSIGHQFVGLLGELLASSAGKNSARDRLVVMSILMPRVSGAARGSAEPILETATSSETAS